MKAGFSWPLSTGRTLICGGVICALFVVEFSTESHGSSGATGD